MRAYARGRSRTELILAPKKNLLFVLTIIYSIFDNRSSPHRDLGPGATY
jgi:hypothetical protein